MSTDTQKTPGGWRWGRITLIASLALNLLFVGAIGGSIWAMWAGYWSGPRHHAFAGAVHHLMRTLPDERRKTVRQVLRGHRGEIKPLRREVRKARRAAARAMRREPLDEAALRNALGELRAAETKISAAVAEMAVELAKTLDLEERRELLHGLARHGRFGGKRGKRGDRRRGDIERKQSADKQLEATPGDDKEPTVQPVQPIQPKP